MKKILFAFSVAFLMLCAGCAKEYNCKCTYPGFVYGTGNVEKTSEIEYKGTKKQAEKSCDEYEDLLKNLHGDANCTLE